MTDYKDDLRDLSDIEHGTILAEWFDDGIKAVIVRGPAAMCAYLGVPVGHPLAGHDYNNVPLAVHGGLTFASEGGGFLPEGFYYYGWDYAHAGDHMSFGTGIPMPRFHDDKEWTLGEVKSEVQEALWDFKSFVKLAEAIKREAVK